MHADNPDPQEAIVDKVVSIPFSRKILLRSLSDLRVPVSLSTKSWKNTFLDPAMCPFLSPARGSSTSPLNLGGGLASIIYVVATLLMT
jgi:hypothetical protein